MMEVDSKEVLRMFANLNSKLQNKVIRKALTDGAKILQKASKQNLRNVIGRAVSHKNWWDGKTLQSGIKISSMKNEDGVKVHIMKDFRLKYFELGTVVRRTSGNNKSLVRGKRPLYRQNKPHSTGAIKLSNFFTNALKSTEKQIFNNIDSFISLNIQRIANK